MGDGKGGHVLFFLTTAVSFQLSMWVVGETRALGYLPLQCSLSVRPNSSCPPFHEDGITRGPGR